MNIDLKEQTNIAYKIKAVLKVRIVLVKNNAVLPKNLGSVLSWAKIVAEEEGVTEGLI